MTINNAKKKAAEKYLGMTRTMNCGLKATVITYRNSRDIDVKFENGVIRKHMKPYYFITGEIGLNRDGIRTDYIGHTRIMNCGMKATIIDYHNSNDIDVQFENGNIRRHMSMSSFKNGGITPESLDETQTNYIGMTRTMNCGMKATIIEYKRCNDVDVQFENGIICKHRRFDDFLKGRIQRPYLGRAKTMNCGLKATIIHLNEYKDIDVKFEDGTICKHTTMMAFNRSSIPHPTSILFNKYRVGGVAFKFHNTTYFYVAYVENGEEISEVMCIDDMKQKLPIH